jgi:hypothetical protein
MQSVMSQIAFEKNIFIVSFDPMENPSWGIELLSNQSVSARGSEVGSFSPGAIDFVHVWWCLGDAHHRLAYSYLSLAQARKAASSKYRCIHT